MALTTRHTHTDNNTRTKTYLTTSAFGAITGQAAHAVGGYAVGSDIPAGRFVVDSPASLVSDSRNERMMMLPDKLGTNLFQADGVTDFSGDIASALRADGTFPIVGVSSYAGREDKEIWKVGDVVLTQPAGKPIGYEDEQSKWNYYPIRSAVDVVTSGSISVYTEVDITPADDTLYIRVAITDANATPPQLLGGVTNTNNAGVDTGLQLAPSNIRIDNGGKAGSSVTLHLAGLA